MDFQDQVVVITGAGGGMGRATALAFAKEGARLALTDAWQSSFQRLFIPPFRL